MAVSRRAASEGDTMRQPNWRAFAEGTAIPLAILIVWQIVCALGLNDPLKLPSPFAVFIRFWRYVLPEQPLNPAAGFSLAWLFSGEFFRDAAGSLYRITIGFLVGAALAFPVGLAMGNSPLVYRMMNPLLQVLRPIPPIAYIPLSMNWFGLGNPPAIFLIALGAFFPILINTIDGVRTVDSIYLRAARNLGASQLTIFRRVILPAAMPHILSGVRVGIGTAFIVVIVAEMIAVNNGLGFRILESREGFWTDKIIAGMFAIGLVGFAIDTVFDRLNRHLLRWHRGLENN